MVCKTAFLFGEMGRMEMAGKRKFGCFPSSRYILMMFLGYSSGDDSYLGYSIIM
jgi:hypothetical protein